MCFIKAIMDLFTKASCSESNKLLRPKQKKKMFYRFGKLTAAMKKLTIEVITKCKEETWVQILVESGSIVTAK
jgi:hypothetical protein